MKCKQTIIAEGFIYERFNNIKEMELWLLKQIEVNGINHGIMTMEEYQIEEKWGVYMKEREIDF